MDAGCAPAVKHALPYRKNPNRHVYRAMLKRPLEKDAKSADM